MCVCVIVFFLELSIVIWHHGYYLQHDGDEDNDDFDVVESRKTFQSKLQQQNTVIPLGNPLQPPFHFSISFAIVFFKHYGISFVFFRLTIYIETKWLSCFSLLKLFSKFIWLTASYYYQISSNHCRSSSIQFQI